MQNGTVYIHVCKILSWCDTTRQKSIFVFWRSKVTQASSVWTQGRCSLALKGHVDNIYFMCMIGKWCLLLILIPSEQSAVKSKQCLIWCASKRCIYTKKMSFSTVCAQLQQRRHKNVLKMTLYDKLRLVLIHKQTQNDCSGNYRDIKPHWNGNKQTKKNILSIFFATKMSKSLIFSLFKATMCKKNVIKASFRSFSCINDGENWCKLCDAFR